MDSVYTRKTRVFAWAMCVFFAVSLCLSTLFLVLSADHQDCHEDDCAVCSVIRLCKTVSQNLGTTPGFSGVWLLFVSFTVILTLTLESRYIATASPVLAKVRLNN